MDGRERREERTEERKERGLDMYKKLTGCSCWKWSYLGLWSVCVYLLCFN